MPADLQNISTSIQPLRAQNFLPRGDGSKSDLVSITSREQLSKINVRAYDKDVLTRLGKILGCSMPRNNKVVSPRSKDWGDCELLWLGPNELLLRSQASEPDSYPRVASLEQGLQDKNKSLHFAVVDVSDYYTVVRVSGERARAILQKNCPLDFHSSVFQAGDCAQSIYGKSSVLFSCALEHSFDLQVRISLSGYLWSLLELSSRSERD